LAINGDKILKILTDFYTKYVTAKRRSTAQLYITCYNILWILSSFI